MVSIVVPFYNCVKFLSKCLNSIQKQTYHDLEVLLIDDGSTDGSDIVCNAFAQKDARFHVFRQKKSGVSAARNHGIEEAHGQYLFFLDGDDWLSLDAIEKMEKSMEKYSADIVNGNMLLCKPLSNAVLFHCPNDQTVYDKTVFEQYKECCSICDYGACARLFKTEIIRANHIFFPQDIRLGEDKIFVHTYLKYCRQLVCISDIVYFYNKLNLSSLTHQMYEEYPIWKYQMALAYVESYAGIPNDDKVKKETQQCFLSFWVEACQYVYLLDDNREKKIERLKSVTALFANQIDIKKQDENAYFNMYKAAYKNGDYDQIERFIVLKQKKFPKMPWVKHAIQWFVIKLRYMMIYRFNCL